MHKATVKENVNFANVALLIEVLVIWSRVEPKASYRYRVAMLSLKLVIFKAEKCI